MLAALTKHLSYISDRHIYIRSIHVSYATNTSTIRLSIFVCLLYVLCKEHNSNENRMVDKIRLFDSLLNVGRNPAAQPHWMNFAFRGNREVGAGGYDLHGNL